MARRNLFSMGRDENNNVKGLDDDQNAQIDCEKPNPFDTLPDNVISKIMNMLALKNIRAMKLTCKRFLSISNEKRFWKGIEIKDRIVNVENLQLILEHKPHFFQLTHSRIQVLDKEKLLSFPISSNLLFLDLSYSKLKTNVLTTFFKTLVVLKKLSLETLDLRGGVVEAMEIFAPTISVLNLCSCYNIKATELSSFLTKTIGLRDLNIGHIKSSVEKNKCFIWSKMEFEIILKSLPLTLEALDLSGYRCLPVNEHLSLVVQSCPNLKSLDLSDNANPYFNLQQEGNIASLRKLEYLGVSRCNLKVRVLSDHFQNLPRLKFVNIYNAYFLHEKFQQFLAEHPYIHFNTSLGDSIGRPVDENSKPNTIWGVHLRPIDESLEQNPFSDSD